METDPVPHRTFSNSHLLAVSTRQSHSGVAKEMRADFCGFPDFTAASEPVIASLGVGTLRVTVFIHEPPDIVLKVGEELAHCSSRCREEDRKGPSSDSGHPGKGSRVGIAAIKAEHESPALAGLCFWSVTLERLTSIPRRVWGAHL